MSDEKVKVTIKMSEDERATLKRLADGGNMSDYLRKLAASDAQQRGIRWPDDTRDTRGKYDRPTS